VTGSSLSQYATLINGDLDALLAQYFKAVPSPQYDAASEADAVAFVERVRAIAHDYLKRGIETAARDLAAHGSSDAEDITLAALNAFAESFKSALLPMQLKSRMKGWSRIDDLIENAAMDFRAALDESWPPAAA